MTKTTKLIANGISGLTHPVLVPTFGAFLIYNSESIFSQISFDTKLNIFLITFGLTFVLPMVFILLFLGFKEFTKLKSSNKNERVFPLLIVLLSYSFAYDFLKDNTVLLILNTFLLSVIAGLTLALIINFFWKISLHMVGVGGIISLAVFLKQVFFADTYIYFIIFVFIAGIIASIRLFLQEHSSLQIISGFALGFSAVASLHFIL